MKEKRKFNRWYVEEKNNVSVVAPQLQEEGTLLDVSAGGMKISLMHPLAVGTTVYGKFEVLPKMGPFFVRGKVIRARKKDTTFETVVEFKNVCTIELTVELYNKVTDILNH